jgi:pyruvate dehydrogenase (quinone)
LLDQKSDGSHLGDALHDYAKAGRDLDALAESGPYSSIIHPQYVMRLVSQRAKDDAIFTCDVGTPIIWTARYLKVNGRRRIVGSFNHGSMANAMPLAMGAQAAFPKRPVISMSGDGGFTMMMGDFLTLAQGKLPVRVVVLNNGTLGFIQMEQMASGFLDTGCELRNPNFASMTETAGIKGIRVEKPQDLELALAQAFSHDGPALVDVVSARQELAMPPKTTADQAYHFGMFTMKAVLDGRAKQLIELAKVNLPRR